MWLDKYREQTDPIKIRIQEAVTACLHSIINLSHLALFRQQLVSIINENVINIIFIANGKYNINTRT